MTGKRGRKPNPNKPELLTISVSDVTKDYLDTLARGSTLGHSANEVAHKFIRDGIERAIQERIIRRRKIEPTYPVED